MGIGGIGHVHSVAEWGGVAKLRNHYYATIDSSVIDQYGHMNYKAYPALFEPAQDEFMDSRGIGFVAIETRFGLRSVVKLMQVTCHGELLAGDSVDIATFAKAGTTSITYVQIAMKSDAVAAEMKLVVVLVDKDGKPTPVPDEIREKIG